MNRFQGLFGCLILCASCGEPQDNPSRPFVARLISSEGGEYALRQVTFSTLEDIATVSGTYGQLRGSASLSVDSNASEVIASADPDSIYSHRGGSVQTDYQIKSGVIIPRNFQTMEMLSLYYNIERIAQFWTDNMGIDFQAIGFPGLFYNPKLSSEVGGVTQEVEAVMNAAYLPGVRDMWFFRTSPRENIPVKMNFAVVAHEFGHFIFDYRFANFDPKTYQPLLQSNERFLSGLNEGLADFFAYLVTRSPREFAKSLTKLDVERSLPVAWTYSSIKESGCKGGFYCEGSLLASALYEISQEPGVTAVSVGRMVYQALPIFRTAWISRQATETFDYADFLAILIKNSEDKRALYCTVFRKWFDVESLRVKLPCT